MRGFDTMRAFNNMKRELRTLYRPKGIPKTRARSSVDRKGAAELIDTGSTIQLAHVPSTPDSGRPEDSKSAMADQNAGQPGANAQLLPGEECNSLDQKLETESSRSATTCEATIPDLANESAAEHESGLVEYIPTDSPVAEETELSTVENTGLFSLEEAQAIREQYYVAFTYEAPEDYTSGPCRLVATTDGIQGDCTALLVTFDLSAKIQDAIHGQRDFARAEVAGLFQRQSLSRLEFDVDNEITSCKARLAGLEEEGQAESEEAQKLYQQQSNLEAMLEDVQARRQNIRTDVEVVQAERLRMLQAEVNKHLEDAFIAARLLAPEEEKPEPEIEDLDVQKEYQEFCEKLARVNDIPFEESAPPLDISREHLKAKPLTEEQQAELNIVDNLWRAKEELDQTRRDFENREAEQAQEKRRSKVRPEEDSAASANESPEDFDVRWVMRNQQLTRNLIEAEATYSAKKRELLEAGIPLPFNDVESVFNGTYNGTDGFGYEMPSEQEIMAAKPSPSKVRHWLSKVPEGESPVEVVRDDPDDWEAEEVGISDSVSLVAEGKERMRIDRWRKACSET